MLDQRQRLKLLCNTLGNKHNKLNHIKMIKEALMDAKPLIIAPGIPDSAWNQLSHDKKLDYFKRMDEDLRNEVESNGVVVRKMTTLKDTVLIKTEKHELYATLVG